MKLPSALRRASVCWIAIATLAGCTTLVPALSSMVSLFAQGLITSASANYSPRYAAQVERLLVALLRQGTGLRIEPQLSGNGTPQTRSTTDAFRQAAVRANDDLYAKASAYTDAFAQPDRLSMDVAVLARRAGGDAIEPIQDGETLRDGNGDPARGDLLRFHVTASCDCYVYVMGVDSTGYVARIFPDPGAGLVNPVAAGRNYLVPGGDQWWGLDDQAGVEHVYFVASRRPRTDIEEAWRGLSAEPRRPVVANRVPVQDAALIVSRGLVKVSASPVPVAMAGRPVSVSPDSFVSGGTDSITVTRWFHHD